MRSIALSVKRAGQSLAPHLRHLHRLIAWLKEAVAGAAVLSIGVRTVATAYVVGAWLFNAVLNLINLANSIRPVPLNPASMG